MTTKIKKSIKIYSLQVRVIMCGWPSKCGSSLLFISKVAVVVYSIVNKVDTGVCLHSISTCSNVPNSLIQLIVIPV